MSFEFERFAFIAAVSVALCAAVLGGQQTKTKSNPPADPPAKTLQPATHFTQGTIASISANQMVIARKVRGKAKQASFMLNSQTQRNGHLAAGTRVSVQYREEKGQKVAAAVHEFMAKNAAGPDSTTFTSRPKG
jgi:hypothetical protein